MIYRDLKLKIKEEQKTLAQDIHNGKVGRKPSKRTDENSADWNDLEWNQWEYRHKHIAYCEFFNNTEYALIENFCYDGPDRSKVDNFKTEWEDQLDETLRDCA